LIKSLKRGKYRVKIQAPSLHGKRNNALNGIKVYMTIAYADNDVNEEYNESWPKIEALCHEGEGFPLSLR
jgi:hypothetical protein